MLATDMTIRPDPAVFETKRITVRDGVELAYVREGEGGVPLLLLHGWPETKRIWWRNIGPLAAAGFDVIAPDLRGFGESPTVADGFYDVATMSEDVKALLDVLGIPSAVFAGGDYGGMITQDIGHRFPGLVRRQVLFNTLTPTLPELYEEHGVGGDALAEVNAVSEHVVRHGNEADDVAAGLPDAAARKNYVAGFYTYRLWGMHGAFSPEEVDFMVDPYGDAASFRASLVLYESFFDPEKLTDIPKLGEPHDVRTLILYGSEDRVVGPAFSRRMQLACSDYVGPFIIERGGHYLQYERAEVFNEAVQMFCQDLLTEATAQPNH